MEAKGSSQLSDRRSGHAPDLLVCCRCGAVASRVYTSFDQGRRSGLRPLAWETHRGADRQVCGECISASLDAALQLYFRDPTHAAYELERAA
jgi:hypothetical protein